MRLLIFSLDASFQLFRSPVLTLYLAFSYIMIRYKCYQNQLNVNLRRFIKKIWHRSYMIQRELFELLRYLISNTSTPMYVRKLIYFATNYCRDFSSSSREKVQNITGEIFTSFTRRNTSFIIMKSFSGFTYNKMICNDTYLD